MFLPNIVPAINVGRTAMRHNEAPPCLGRLRCATAQVLANVERTSSETRALSASLVVGACGGVDDRCRDGTRRLGAVAHVSLPRQGEHRRSGLMTCQRKKFQFRGSLPHRPKVFIDGKLRPTARPFPEGRAGDNRAPSAFAAGETILSTAQAPAGSCEVDALAGNYRYHHRLTKPLAQTLCTPGTGVVRVWMLLDEQQNGRDKYTPISRTENTLEKPCYESGLPDFDDNNSFYASGHLSVLLLLFLQFSMSWMPSATVTVSRSSVSASRSPGIRSQSCRNATHCCCCTHLPKKGKPPYHGQLRCYAIVATIFAQKMSICNRIPAMWSRLLVYALAPQTQDDMVAGYTPMEIHSQTTGMFC